MSIVQQRCPACAAPLPIQPGERRLKCIYCGSALSVERHGDQISLELAEQVIGKIEQSGAQAQAEFERMRLTQELHNAEMRLANVKSEMRGIQRGPMNAISRTHLNELHQEALALQKRIDEIKAKLDPTAQPTTNAPAQMMPRLSLPRLIWLFTAFDGRATRPEFWVGIVLFFAVFIITAIVRAVLNSIGLAVGEGTVEGFFAGAINLVAAVQFIVLAWIVVVVGIKRFQDRDKPGWWVLLGFIPVFGVIWLLVELGFLPGTPGPNRFG